MLRPETMTTVELLRAIRRVEVGGPFLEAVYVELARRIDGAGLEVDLRPGREEAPGRSRGLLVEASGRANGQGLYSA